MKNYYEILEVSSNASPEVIEKAYKALVKKYHPDLQPNDKKAIAENKIKLINEAYDVLSNQQKKIKYDEQVKAQKIKENSPSAPNNSTTSKSQKKPTDYTKIMNEAYTNAYNEAYINTLKNMGYEIQYERTFKEKFKIFLAAILAFIFIIFIGFILWHISFVKHYFTDLYTSNEIFKIFVDLINNIFSGFFSLFK